MLYEINFATLRDIQKGNFEPFKEIIKNDGVTHLSIPASFCEQGTLENIVNACEKTNILAITLSGAKLPQIITFLKALKESETQVRALGFTDTYMPLSDFNAIVGMLPPQVNEIDFGKNIIQYFDQNNEGSASLLGENVARKGLRFFHLEGTTIDRKDLLPLIQALCQSKTLRCINLNGALRTIESQETAVELVDLLSNSQSPSIALRLRGNMLGALCAEALGQKINKAPSLRSIDLGENNFGASAITLIDTLDRAESIKINLSKNKIGAVKGNEVALMESVAATPCITHLDLRHNQIDWQGQALPSWVKTKGKNLVRSVLQLKNKDYENRNLAELFLYYAIQTSAMIKLDDSSALIRQVHKSDLLEGKSLPALMRGSLENTSLETFKERYVGAIAEGMIKEEKKK